MPSLRKNIYYNTILNVAQYAFPLIVYPYVSRVLGVSNIGLVGFIDSIATYFILFSMMGISIIGVRETARCGGDKAGLRSVFESLFALHALMTLLAGALMITAAFTVTELRNRLPMMGVGLCKLIFNLFLIEWFYRGLEDFRFITYRSVIIRAVYTVSVFIFVRGSGDTLVYYFLTMLVVAVTGAVNFLHSRRFMAKRREPVDIRKYLKPYFVLGLYVLLATAYTTLNTSFLGFATDDTQVGYYYTAVKLISILSTIYFSFSGVLMPRMSSLAASGDFQLFKRYTKRALSIVLIICLPVAVIIEIFAPDVIMLLSGAGYEGAVRPLRIMMPFFLLMAVEQLFTLQVLMPMRRERAIFRNTICGAVTGVVLNIILVPRFGAVGSAWVWGGAQTVIFICACVSVYNNKRLRYV